MNGKARRHHRRVAWHVMTPDKAFWTFAAFVVLVFLMGGGSRYDIDSVGPLRALSAIFLAIGVYFQTEQSFKRVAPAVVLILLLGLWMAIQLIPLPPSWWMSLHGREAIARAGELMGLGDMWRPITFSPLRTFNSLASLVVPLAAFMLLSLLNEGGWHRLQNLIFAAGVLSALLGIAQISLSGFSGLYLYDITNDESAVGLFSNRNHNALFLNIALLFRMFQHRDAQANWKPVDLFIVAGQIVLIAGILINGSRFGFALLGFVAVIFAVREMRGVGATGGIATTRLRKFYAAVAGIIALGLISLFAAMDRIPALSRIFQKGVAQDLRAQSFPDVLEMAVKHFPFGVGFGAFEQAYRTIESERLLSPIYLNQAHDDWLQIAIEGGLPAVVLLLLALLLILKRAFSIFWSKGAMGENLATPTLGLLTLIAMGMHSVVDYPLRVPSLMVIAAIAVSMVFKPTSGTSRA